jgi:hypothetical protein
MPAARDKKRVWFNVRKKECGSFAMLQTAQYSQLQLISFKEKKLLIKRIEQLEKEKYEK